MFNLEQSITEWRQQMLAAGIQSPVPLDELESHLREEIEHRMKAGLNIQRAFETAVQRIGGRNELKAEFVKAGSFRRDIGSRKTECILGVLWFVQCAWFLISIASSPAVGELFFYSPQVWPQIRTFLVFFTTMYLTGAIGSILLIGGLKPGASILRVVALLELILCLARDGSFAPLISWGGEIAVFCLITLWLLRPARIINPVASTN